MAAAGPSSLLFEAIEAGDYDRVKSALDAGASAAARNERGVSPVSLLCSPETIKTLLVRAHPSGNLKAAAAEFIRIRDLLVSKGAEFDENDVRRILDRITVLSSAYGAMDADPSVQNKFMVMTLVLKADLKRSGNSDDEIKTEMSKLLLELVLSLHDASKRLNDKLGFGRKDGGFDYMIPLVLFLTDVGADPFRRLDYRGRNIAYEMRKNEFNSIDVLRHIRIRKDGFVDKLEALLRHYLELRAFRAPIEKDDDPNGPRTGAYNLSPELIRKFLMLSSGLSVAERLAASTPGGAAAPLPRPSSGPGTGTRAAFVDVC
jgi:hypothetical protein